LDLSLGHAHHAAGQGFDGVGEDARPDGEVGREPDARGARHPADLSRVGVRAAPGAATQADAPAGRATGHARYVGVVFFSALLRGAALEPPSIARPNLRAQGLSPAIGPASLARAGEISPIMRRASRPMGSAGPTRAASASSARNEPRASPVRWSARAC